MWHTSYSYSMIISLAGWDSGWEPHWQGASVVIKQILIINVTFWCTCVIDMWQDFRGVAALWYIQASIYHWKPRNWNECNLAQSTLNKDHFDFIDHRFLWKFILSCIVVLSQCLLSWCNSIAIIYRISFQLPAVFCPPSQLVAEGGYWITLRPSVRPSGLNNFKSLSWNLNTSK